MRNRACSFSLVLAAIHAGFAFSHFARFPYLRPSLPTFGSLCRLHSLAQARQPSNQCLKVFSNAVSYPAVPNTKPSHASPGCRPAEWPTVRFRIAERFAPSVASSKMDEDDRSISKALASQNPIVRELVQEDIERGVLIPLKTTLELRDDYQTGHVLITRTPTKAANPAIL